MFNILLVEDDDDDAFMLTRALDREGVRSSVHRVSNGQQAMSYLRGEGDFSDRGKSPFPHIIFTDLNMPGMDGFGVLEWLRANPQYQLVPTMVLSSSGQDEDIVKAYRMGANAYLIKPDSLVELQKLVRAAYDFWTRCLRPTVSCTQC